MDTGGDGGGLVEAGGSGAHVWPPAPSTAADSAILPTVSVAVEALPYTHGGSRLSRFRGGEAVLSPRRLRLSGRFGPPRSLRARVYLLGGLGFLPGVAIAYLMLERAPWGRETMDIAPADVVSVSCRPDYRLITIVYRPEGQTEPAARAQSLTFQVDSSRYGELCDALDRYFPGKLERSRLRAAFEPGAEYAWFGIALWTVGVAAACLSQM